MNFVLYGRFRSDTGQIVYMLVNIIVSKVIKMYILLHMYTCTDDCKILIIHDLLKSKV
jgi:hypothetical protein